MANTLWSKLNNRNKIRKSNYDISKKTNIPEEKVGEIMRGERTVPTTKVDSFAKAIQEDNSVELSMDTFNAKKWALETDLKAKRQEFNYSSQVELAQTLGVDSSTICRLENKNLNHISDRLIRKIYDFYQDELNKKVNTTKRKVAILTKPSRTGYQFNKEELKGLDFDTVYAWYDNFDLAGYLNENKITTKKFAKVLGYAKGSRNMLDSVIHHRADVSKTGRAVFLKIYSFVNGNKEVVNNKPILEPVEPQIESDSKMYEVPTKVSQIAPEVPIRPQEEISVEDTRMNEIKRLIKEKDLLQKEIESIERKILNLVDMA